VALFGNLGIGRLTGSRGSGVSIALSIHQVSESTLHLALTRMKTASPAFQVVVVLTACSFGHLVQRLQLHYSSLGLALQLASSHLRS